MAEKFTTSSFEKEVLSSDLPVLVDFWASWCGPCRMLAPVIDELAAEADGYRVGKVNVDEEPELAERYGAQVTGVDDLNQTFELLLSGRIDATLNAEVSFYDYVKAHPEADVKIAVLDENATQVAIPMRKGEETASLREAVNQALAELEEAGELSALSETYFGIDISRESAQEAGGANSGN